MHALIPYVPQWSFTLPFELPIVGSLTIHLFGILVAAGFLAGGKVAMNRARDLGLDPEAINRLIGWLVVGTFVGGHVGYLVMYKPERLDINDPMGTFYALINVFDGLSSFGGFFACVPLAVYFFWKNKLPIWPYMDSLAIGLALGWGLGRTGCFVAHDHVASPTNFWLAVDFGVGNAKCPSGSCHDMGLYEALFSYGTFMLFLWLDRKPRVPGFYPLLLGLLYAPTRFMLDFARPETSDPRWGILNLTGAQYGALVVFAIAAIAMTQRLKSGDTPWWRDRDSWVDPEEKEKDVIPEKEDAL